MIRWKPEETEELQRRRRQLLYYLVRDPVWARLILPNLQRISKGPLKTVTESLIFWQEYFMTLNPS